MNHRDHDQPDALKAAEQLDAAIQKLKAPPLPWWLYALLVAVGGFLLLGIGVIVYAAIDTLIGVTP